MIISLTIKKRKMRPFFGNININQDEVGVGVRQYQLKDKAGRIMRIKAFLTAYDEKRRKLRFICGAPLNKNGVPKIFFSLVFPARLASEITETGRNFVSGKFVSATCTLKLI